MKITQITCTPFALPLKKPLHFALATMAVSEQVLVEVHTDEGIVGVAEAPARPWSGFYGESLPSIVHAIDEWFAPALCGLDPFGIERAWSVLSLVENNHAAKAAIDIALHDIMGQAAGVSCRRLLGGWTDTLRMVYICGAGDAGAIVEEMQQVRERWGIDAFKLKIGLDAAQDLRTLVQVRKALPDVELNVDGNQALDARTALRVLQAAAEHGLAWAEEPCAVHDRAGRAQLARLSPVPILGDESCRSPEEVARELTDGSIHMASVKTARTGFHKSAQVLALAGANRAGCVVASHADSGIGLIAGWHFAAAHRETARHATELSFFLHYQQDVLAEPLQIQGGHMSLPERPGLGIVIDRNKIARLRVQ
jgi:L-Ala-D/L-Glu epimerase